MGEICTGKRRTVVGQEQEALNLKVLAHARKAGDHVDAQAVEQRGGANTRSLKDGRGMNRTGGDEDFLGCADGCGPSAAVAGKIAQSGGLGPIKQDPVHGGVGEQVVVGPRRDRIVLTGSCIASRASYGVDTGREREDALGLSVGWIRGGRQTSLDAGIVPNIYKVS